MYCIKKLQECQYFWIGYLKNFTLECFFVNFPIINCIYVAVDLMANVDFPTPLLAADI